jgi:hypothetical protein
MIRPPELSGNRTSSHLVPKEELAKEVMNLALRSIFVYTSKGSLTSRKILRHGADGFTSPGHGCLYTYTHCEKYILFLAKKTKADPLHSTKALGGEEV